MAQVVEHLLCKHKAEFKPKSHQKKEKRKIILIVVWENKLKGSKA
jgi:hypothetical protein